MRRATAALAIWLVAAPAAAACPKTTLGDLENEVMCPVCGTSLALASEAPQAKRQRAFIERLIAECRSKEQIKTALAAEFGDEVLAEPSGEGFGLAAYLIPAAILLGAGTAVTLGVRRWRRRARTHGAGPGAGEDSSKRLDEDLARYDL